MANANVFGGGVSAVRKASKKPDAMNKAGGTAYAMADEAALAQYACTGTFNDTFYSKAEPQMKETLVLAQKVSPEFLAKCAIYAREQGFMKDMPAFLLAVLSTRDVELFKKTFPRVIDNGKMLRNFVQIMRSGAVGRKSLGSAPKKAISAWLKSRKDASLFRDSVGDKPSMADVIKMVHPQPESKTREALYAYMIGKKLTTEQEENLPGVVKSYEQFKSGKSTTVPDVDFRMLTSLSLTEKNWKTIAENAGWMMTRMNLNTFERHGVLKDQKMVQMIADRLASKAEVEKARAFPYQLLTAYLNADPSVPQQITNALQQAMEHSTANVPTYAGKVYVMIDVSGSMNYPVTGHRAGATTKTTCKDVAALVAASVLRKNPQAEVILFHTDAWREKLNPFDSIMTNAQKIMKAPGGGTNCAAPVALLNREKAEGDLIIMVSDNESWAHSYAWSARYGGNLQSEWDVFKTRNPKAKLVCIDIQVENTTQATSRKDTLNVGGFSDNVFDVINQFAANTGSATFWTDRINEVAL